MRLKSWVYSTVELTSVSGMTIAANVIAMEMLKGAWWMLKTILNFI